MSAEACHPVQGFDVPTKAKPSGGETVNTFHFLDAQRQTAATGSAAGPLLVTEEYLFHQKRGLLQSFW